MERSGAAHGLSEVLMAKGADRIEMLLPDILTNAGNQDLKVFGGQTSTKNTKIIQNMQKQVVLLELCSIADR